MDMVYCSSSSSTASSASTSSSYSSPPTPPAAMPSTRALRSSFSSSSSEKPLWRDIASRKYSLQQAQDALEAGVQSFAGSHSDDRAPEAASYRDALLLDDLTAWSLGQGSSTQVQSSSPRLSAQPQWTIVNPFGNSVTNDDDESTSDESRHALHRSSVSPSWLDHDDDDDTSISTSARTSSPPLFPFKRDSRCPAVIATSPSPPRAAAASSHSSSSSASVREAARALFALSSEAERQEAMELAAQWKREETRMGRLSFQVGKAAKEQQQQQQQPVREPLAQPQVQRQSMPQPQAPAPARPQRRTKAASLPPLLQPPPRTSISRPVAAAAAKATLSSTAQVVPSSPLPDSTRSSTSSSSSSESNRARSLSMLDSVANELALMSEMARSQSWCEVSTPRSRSPSPLMWAVGHGHQERRLSMAGVATVMMST